MLAALDATVVDPVLGRAVVSVVRLRAHLAALPSPDLSEFALSQVCILSQACILRPCCVLMPRVRLCCRPPSYHGTAVIS